MFKVDKQFISIGLGRNIDQYSNLPVDENLNNLIEEKVKTVWGSAEYQAKSGSGIRANSRIPIIVPLGEEIFKNEDPN